MKFVHSTLSLAILTTLSTYSFANQTKQASTTDENSPPVKLNTIVVQAEKKIEVGKTVYSKEDLQKTPNSSKNITDFLKVNPNVQFSNDHRASSEQAELKPAEISINGAQTYRNKFIINGVNSTNNTDPMGSGHSYDGKLNSGSQGIAINTDLICELELLDSNISAEYGEFTGGVVKASTCTPDSEIGKLHGSISYDYTESDWANFHFANDEEQDEFLEPTFDNQKDFKKHGLSANIYSKLSDKWGINLYGSTRESLIPVLSELDNPLKVENQRHNYNLGSTLFYTPSETNHFKFGFDFGNLESTNYVKQRLDSRSLTNSETLTLFGEIKSKLDNSLLTQNISYQNMSNTRENDNSLGIIWKQTPTKNWSTNPGQGSASSDIDLEQNTFSYSLKNVFDPIQVGKASIVLSFGLGYDHTNASWERPTDTYMYNAPKIFSDATGLSCNPNDFLCEAPSEANRNQGQYLSNGKYYKAGKANVSQERIHTFLENKMVWDNFSTRLGLRADYDSLSKNLNIAPRSAFSYKPLQTDVLTLTTGWNRYYSNYTLNTELRDEIAHLEYNLKRTKNAKEDIWNQSSLSDVSFTNATIRRSDLDTPYSDEIVVGINSQIKNLDIGLKWVNRDNKDEITKSRYTVEGTKNTIDYYEYSNMGQSQADIYTLTLSNIKPLNFKNTDHLFRLAFDYNEIEKNYVSYVDSFNVNSQTASEDRNVIYNGKLIRFNERPVENFNQPWTTRISWDINFQNAPIKISNFLSYKSSYKDTYKLKDKALIGQEEVEVYATNRINPRFTWDMRGTYDWKLSNNYTAVFGLTVNNITDRHNIYTSENITSSSNTLKSELGRQFIADVTFKF